LESHPALKKAVIISAIAFSGFFILYFSIMFKGIVANILTQIDNTLYTQFLSTRERLSEEAEKQYSNVVIVGIDDRTLNKLGAYNPHKYRRYHIPMLENILKGEPKAVVYDIYFGDPHDDPNVDRMLSDVMKKGPVFSVFFGAKHDRSGEIFNKIATKVPDSLKLKLVNEKGFESISPEIFQSLKGAGLANAYPDKDGLLRKMPIFFNIKDGLYPTIAMEVFRETSGISRNRFKFGNDRIETGDLTIPVDEHGRAYVNIDEKHKIREIPFYDVYKGRMPGRFFKDKIVFIAATASGLGDMKLVPLYGYISGVKVHANLYLNMLHKNFIRELSVGRYYLVILLVSFIYTFLFFFRGEHPPLKRMMIYFTGTLLALKLSESLLKIPFISRIYQKFKTLRNKSYGIRLFFLILSETQKRIEPIVVQVIILYLALFFIFNNFHIFIKPSALLIQLFISYIIVSEYKMIDFSKISDREQSSE
jgi:CHASE2 domain-containing sensor protein